jgi:hypothetical protein
MATISSLLIRLSAILVMIPPLSALAGEIHCPSVREGAKLSTVTLFDGPPSEHADLMPDSSREGKGGTRSEWQVAYIFKAGRRLYVECKYGPTISAVMLEPEPSTYKCEFASQGDSTISLTCLSH